jgi:hypothetical protein
MDLSEKMSSEHRTRVNDLAKVLLVRHLQISMPDDLRDALLTGDVRRECRRTLRVLALVGAGASAPYLKRADKLVEGLLRDVELDRPGYDEELHRLTLVNGMDVNAFETKLAALSRTNNGERKVRAAIAAQLGLRHPAQLRYELLAHLMKHGFLDGIISVNFDELLDQSLDDEVGPGEYVSIVSARDCARASNYDRGSSDRLPVYVKLHGTVADPHSLRFTKDAYYAVPADIVDAVRGILGTEDCVLLNVGCSMRGLDLAQLLDYPRSLTIYNLSKKPIDPQGLEDIDRARRLRGRAAVSVEDMSWAHWDLPKNEDGSDYGMLALTKAVEACAARDAPGVVSLRRASYL